MKNVLTPLVKSVLIPLGLTAAASAKDAANQNRIFGTGTTALIISNEEMEDIMKIVKSRKESRLLIKGISETTKNEVKEEKGEFLGLLLGTLAANALGNMLTGQGTIRRVKEQLELVKIFNVTSSFEIQKYYENIPKFKGVYSRSNLPKIKDGTSIGTHAQYVNSGNVTYFDSFKVEHIPNEIRKFI